MKVCVSAILSACLFVFSPSYGFCASATYTITEAQLTELENHLSELEQNNETLKMLLTEQGELSETALSALMASQSELATLKMQLQAAKSDAQSAKESLQIANAELQKASESFKASEKEHGRTENRLTAQRTIWQIVACVLGGALIAK